MLPVGVLKEAARKFGTPAYVYFETTIREQLEALKRAMTWPKLRILYAIKANSNVELARVLLDEDGKKSPSVLGIDAVSLGEIVLSQKAGMPPSRIIYTGNNATDAQMDAAIRAGVLPNIDSLSRLEKVGRKYPGLTVCVRINPNIGAGHHDHCITGGPESKFGIWYTEVAKILRIARKYHLRIVGVHQHIGSQILNPEKFLFAMDVLLPVARKLPELEFVDFGGGFGVPYKPGERPLNITALGQEMCRRFADFCRSRGQELQMVVEPGRYLVAESGYLLVTVNTIKKIPGGKTFVGVDSGFNHLVRPAMYGSYHHILNLSNPHGRKQRVDVVGQVCESGDKFAIDRPIERPREDDLFAICTAGAYGFSMSSRYLTQPRPIEVLVKPNGEMVCIRLRETIEGITGGNL